MNLPPLPELPYTDKQLVIYDSEPFGKGFDEDEVRAYALSYGRAVQEACAEIAKSFATCPCNGDRGRCTENDVPNGIAAAIRNGVIREGDAP